MPLQALILPLLFLGSFARPAPEGLPPSTSSVVGDHIPSAVVPAPPQYTKEPWHGKLPELHWSTSHGDENMKSTGYSPFCDSNHADFKQDGTDIVTRRIDHTDLRTAFYLGVQAHAAANVGVIFKSMIDDCKEWNEKASKAFTCVWSAIGTVIGFGIAFDRALMFQGYIGQRLNDNGWHVPGFNKRGEVSQLESHLSSVLSADVRHIGIWDGASLSRRSGGGAQPVPRHIFGANLNGREMHFTYMGEANNGSYFRFGHGPGPETENNRRRLKSRETHRYNNQYFDNGGLDFIMETDPGNVNSPDVYFTTDDQNEFDWIYEQVACYLGGWNPFSNPLLAAPGLNFQAYNAYDRVTLAAGAIAPFTKDADSIIGEMTPMGGIETNDVCTANSGHDEL
ncbi:uncharacterized protein GIQ15_03760 [Arthroderma uncinatum]|uniref:uncharacterized protein n=1 Tax=Arthroderma uncinatum TaxID=74035 RepID=UPI00144A5075|nr:uncharacterized protein GIQ15_03760 [Arthroderma uncinatum]KAF3484436.1 hypothetical protein GIQ15_03760 [Arthroderma uncinatum]